MDGNKTEVNQAHQEEPSRAEASRNLMQAHNPTEARRKLFKRVAVGAVGIAIAKILTSNMPAINNSTYENTIMDNPQSNTPGLVERPGPPVNNFEITNPTPDNKTP